jgi:hypothetical protein
MRTGTSVPRVWGRKTPALFLALLQALDRAYPALYFTPLYGVVENSKIHQARAVEQGLAAPPHGEVLFLPPYCPKASPSERAFGEVHDQCTRNQMRKRSWPLGHDVEQPLQVNGPWA